MSRLAPCLQKLAAANRKALTTFITAGDPDVLSSVPALHQMVAAGADILELGVPFSDPEAEGPAIQKSSERALANGITLTACLEMVESFRSQDQQTPIILMGYLNSVMAMGFKTFADAAGAAGVDGLIMVNLPPEEARELKAELARNSIDLIFLIAPTTTPQRAQMIMNAASGFVYYVSLKGITGAEGIDTDAVGERVSVLKKSSPVPVLVGFGIKDAASAAAIGKQADGVVVGSVLVSTMADYADPEERLAQLSSQVADLRAGLDGLIA